METTIKNNHIEANKQNIEQAIENIKQFATDKNFQILGEFKKDGFLQSIFSNNKITFESKSKEKVCRNYLTRLQKKMGMSLANRFLHFLYKKVYKLDKAPRIEYSEQELKIQAARTAWKKSLAETTKLLAEYKTSKKGFYSKV